MLHGTPIVLFRKHDGVAAALLDRCPHRNVPLSSGHVRGEAIECCYHGWQFNGDGTCIEIPCLTQKKSMESKSIDTFTTCEQDGFIWLWAEPNSKPTRKPFPFRLMREEKYTTVIEVLDADASIHAVAENALDVPHTTFLHRGLFRTSRREKLEIDVVVKRFADHVEAEYIGEARPSGLIGKLLAPRSGNVTHFDRFILPSIIEVEYRIGEDAHLLVNAALTPISDYRTKLFAVVSFRVPLPGWLIALIVKPIALKIFGQDARLLRQQSETIQRFREEKYISTEIDVLGPHILGLLKQAERNETAPDRIVERRVRMRL